VRLPFSSSRRRGHTPLSRACVQALWLVACVLISHRAALAQDTNTEAAAPEPTAASVKAIIESGHYADAENAARVLLQKAETSGAADSAQGAEALDLLVEALWQGGKAIEAETKALAERAVALRERLFGPEDPKLALSLVNLANVCAKREEKVAARSFNERALAIQQKAYGPKHKDIAWTLMNLGAISGSDGEFAAARDYDQRALEMLEQVVGPDHSDVGRALNSLAIVELDAGDHAKARALWERALRIMEARLGPNHLRVAMILSNMAMDDDLQGDFASARSRFERTLSVFEQAWGPSHPHVAAALLNLGVATMNLGDYSEAKRLLERSLAIREKAEGPESVAASGPAFCLGQLLSSMGDREGARAFFERVLKCREKALGAGHPLVAHVLYELGPLVATIGDKDQGERLLERALAIQEKSFGPSHERVAYTLVELSWLAIRRGERVRARQLTERAVAILDQQFGPTHIDLALPLEQLARLAEDAGSLDEARSLLERVLETYRRVAGPGHPISTETQADLARLLARIGEARGAMDAALETERLSREHFRLTIRSLGERQALLYETSRAKGLDLAVHLLASSQEAVTDRQRAVFDAVIRSRALVLDEMAARHLTAAAADDRELTQLFDTLARARERLARIVVRGTSDQGIERYNKLVEAARREKEQAEEALAARSLAYSQERSLLAAGLDEVEKALPARAALVAFVRYAPRLKPDTPAKAAEDAAAEYAAFVLKAGSDPLLVPLGSATRVESAVARWQRELRWEAQAPGLAPRRSLARYIAAAGVLRRLVWDPVASSLAESETVFVVPDGLLHAVNLAALPYDDGRFLVEAGPVLHVLSAERDLAAMPQAARGRGLLLVGAPAFGSSRPRAASRGLRGTSAACGVFRRLRFSPLSAARLELKTIGALWKDRAVSDTDSSSLITLQGADADEAAFKNNAPGRRIIHLATHGFALGKACTRNPLVGSGLALAGANRRGDAGPGVEDGILTAEEITALDLAGVEWAVLSACETGVGEIVAGEGVFSLRRAFQIAGARSVIMSLWPVDDASTTAWMANLYRRRLRDRLSTAQAVRQASLDVLRQRRERGRSTHPLYWAGFVGAGDWH
jgi:CHAT domain-containing protein/Tfp pilus assembly protein PilF